MVSEKKKSKKTESADDQVGLDQSLSRKLIRENWKFKSNLSSALRKETNKYRWEILPYLTSGLTDE